MLLRLTGCRVVPSAKTLRLLPTDLVVSVVEVSQEFASKIPKHTLNQLTNDILHSKQSKDADYTVIVKVCVEIQRDSW
jgi:hypothetical protein